VILPIQLNRSVKTLAMLLFVCLPGLPCFADSPSESAGEWKIINYWSTTCAPCRVEIPELNSLSKELAPAGVRVLGVNFDDESVEITRRSARRMKIEFPNLTMAEVQAYGLTAPNVLPTTYILSPENVVMAKVVGLQTRDSLMTLLTDLGVSL
jgi:thiol-disulfide isomerase/thioredoxin